MDILNEIRYFLQETSYKTPITVIYDKGKDNDFTLKSKLISAYQKTKTNIKFLNEDLQELKKHKVVYVHHRIIKTKD